MGAILTILWFITSLIGIVGIIKPSAVLLPSRWVALFLIGLANIFVALAVDYFPEKGQPTPPNPELSLTSGVLILLAISSGVIILFRVSWGAQRFKNGWRPQGSGFVDRMTTAVGERAVAAGEKDKQLYEEKSVKQATESAQAKVDREISAIKRIGNNARADNAKLVKLEPNPKDFEQYQDYEHVPATPPRRTGRSKIPPDLKIRSGTKISILYCDAEGEITEREVIQWRLSPIHLSGFCLLANADRTFRVDRVLEWRDWR